MLSGVLVISPNNLAAEKRLLDLWLVELLELIHYLLSLLLRLHQCMQGLRILETASTGRSLSRTDIEVIWKQIKSKAIHHIGLGLSDSLEQLLLMVGNLQPVVVS